MSASISISLPTGMYEFTMSDAALKAGAAWRTPTFEVFGRRLPATRRFGVVADISRIPEALERFEFEPKQIDWLHEHKIVSDDALDYFKGFHFSGDMLGYAEGRCCFPDSPLLTVRGTFAKCTMSEILLLLILNYDRAIASVASCMVIAVYGRPCMDMGARRGRKRAVASAARATIIGGFTGASDLEASKRYGLRAIGTAAHSFTLLHDSKREALDAQIALLGLDTTLLANTHDVEQGVINAVEAACAAGGELGAVRLDSGDLVASAFKVRGQLDALRVMSTKITVTNDLDEYAIAALGVAPINSYGIGTKLVTGSGVPTAALVYKLVQREDASGARIPVAEKSESKSTVGGRKFAGRVLDEDGYATGEVLVVTDSEEAAKEELTKVGARPLQIPPITGGEIHSELWGPNALEKAQAHHVHSCNELPHRAWRLSEGDAAIPTRYITLQDALFTANEPLTQ